MVNEHELFGSISEVVTSVSLSLAAAPDEQLDSVIDAALGSIARHERADRAYITLYSDNGTFSNSHEWVAEGVHAQRDAIVGFALDAFPWSVDLARRGQVWHCTDVATLPDEAAAERRTFSEFGVTSVLQVPIRNASHTIGVVGFNHLRSSREWQPLTIDLVRRVGEAIGFALLRREITRDLREARDSAERANQAKDRFLSRLSHELHTPLHAILGFAELLDTPGRTAHERQAIRQIIDSGQDLAALLDELLASTEREARVR